MVIRPMRMRASKEDFDDFNKLMNKSKNKKAPGKYKLFSLSSGIGITLAATTLFTVFCKQIN